MGYNRQQPNSQIIMVGEFARRLTARLMAHPDHVRPSSSTTAPNLLAFISGFGALDFPLVGNPQAPQSWREGRGLNKLVLR